jgi:hypothetical protein
MHLLPVTWILVSASFTVLILGLWAYRLSAARSLIMNTLFGSFGMLFAAFQSHVRAQPEWSYVLPFLITMLFLGRAIGLSMRVRSQPDLSASCRVIIAATLVSAVATTAAYLMKAA